MPVHINEAAHVTVQIDAPYDAALDYLADVTNLPRWAVNFIASGRTDGDDYLVTTPMGELPARIEADRNTGVITMLIGPIPPFIGILARTEDGCAFTFLLGKQPNWSAEQFRSDGIPGMVHECEVLAGLIESRAAA